MFLTQSGGLIVKPLSILLGKILTWIYSISLNLNIESIGLSIIVFTAFIRLILIPLMIKQNKSSKIINYIQPELQKVTKKYRGKKDQESMLAQQRETREIQDKYGVNMTSGCLTSLIQFPIFMALYRVIYNLPGYVQQIKDIYIPISDKIFGNQEAINILEKFKSSSNTLKGVNLDPSNSDTIIDVLAKVPSNQWSELAGKFNEAGGKLADISDAMMGASSHITDTYSFIAGIDLTVTPGFKLTAALMIPIFSLIFQYLSMKATPQQNTTDPAQAQTMQTMKTMMLVMPLMSFFITVSVPAGLGLYWATGSLLSFLTTIGINFYFNHCDMEKVVEKSMEKAAKKRAKNEAKGKKSFWDKMQDAAMGVDGNEQSNPKVNSSIATQSLKNYSSVNVNANNENVKYRAGSLASKANIMQRYNDNNNGGK